jgi:hypothetical protein
MIDQPTNDETWGMYDGACVACDGYGRVNDLGLCQIYADKLERDLIRERDWDYAASAFLLSDADREKLRQQIVREHGLALELITSNKSLRLKKHPRPTRREPTPPRHIG